MIDPSGQKGRVLSLLSDGFPRTAAEIVRATSLPAARVGDVASRLHRAGLVALHSRRHQFGFARERKVWVITELGRTRLREALAEKARASE